MYVLNGNKTQIINSDFVERFCISVKDDAALVVASYSLERPPFTLARYKDSDEAKSVLNKLFVALIGGQVGFDMPESLYYDEERRKRDARTKRRGGS